MAVLRDYAPEETKSESLTPLFQSDLNESVSSKNTLLLGATLRTSNFAGRTATVKPGENIDAALGTLLSAGGGILFLQAGTYNLTKNLVGASKISIIGEGRDQTILDFGGSAYGVAYVGTGGAHIDNFRLEGFTIQNSNRAGGLDIDYCDFFSVTDVKSTNNDQAGVRAQNSSSFDMSMVVTSNASNGISLTSCTNANIDKSNISSNTGKGVEFVSGNSDIRIYGATVDANSDDGIKLTATSDKISITATTVSNSGGYGINIAASTCDNNYIIAPTLTSNTSGDINDSGTNTTIVSNLGTNGITLPTHESINGSTTPVAVMVGGNATILTADANNTDLDEFIGFVSADYSSQTPPAYLNGTEASNMGSAPSFTHTINAGVDRALILVTIVTTSSGVPTMPTSASWNGNSLTNIGFTFTATGVGIKTWRYAAGTSQSNQSGTLTVTGAGGTNYYVTTFALNYQYVDQSPVVDTYDTSSASSPATTVSNTITPANDYALIIHGLANNSGNAITLDGNITSRFVGNDIISTVVGDGIYKNTTEKTITSSFSASDPTIAFAIALNPSASTDVSVAVSGRLSGFSGLTPGASYYLSNTAGAISTTPGATSIKVGKALSTTQIAIIQS